MIDGTDALVPDTTPAGGADAGTLLRAGREAAGLSVAAVAQQLKLAPRQIAALEESDFDKLPGRTFIRGFVRNYARLLHLDSDAVLSALPETAPPSSLEYPSLAPTPRPMGELPADVTAKPSLARWAIPLALVAVVCVAAVYEITRPPAEPGKLTASGKPAIDKSVPPLVQPAVEPAVVATPPNTSTALPNPLASEGDRAGAVPENVARGATGSEPNGAGTSASASSSADAPVALSFQGTSWVEVRDGAGVLILSVTGNAGSNESVTGRPPFDVVLGNANAVTVNWQGKAFDTAPYIRQNVARFTLR